MGLFGGGGLLGGISSALFGDQKSTATTRVDPPKWLRPMVEEQAGRVYDVFKGAPPQMYPGATYAGLGRSGMNALNTMQNMPMSELPGQMQDYYSRVLSPDWANQENPYLQNVMSSIEANVLPTVNSQFAGSGRYGSGLHAGTAATGLGNALAPYQFDWVNQRMAEQERAASNAPGAIQAQYLQPQAQLAAAQQAQAEQQRQIDSERERWDYEQNIMPQWVTQGYNVLQGSPYNQSSQPVYRNDLMSMLGAGATVAGLGGPGGFGWWGG